jgi:hypothetical protein
VFNQKINPHALTLVSNVISYIRSYIATCKNGPGGQGSTGAISCVPTGRSVRGEAQLGRAMLS